MSHGITTNNKWKSFSKEDPGKKYVEQYRRITGIEPIPGRWFTYLSARFNLAEFREMKTGDFTHMTTRGYTTIYLLLDEGGEHFIAGRD